MKHHQLSTILAFCLFCFFLSKGSSNAQETKSWTDYRGPHLNGHSAAINIPTNWSDSTNITWKTPIPGQGWSSPVILDNKIWLTTALDNGKELRLIAVEEASGELLHNVLVFEKDSLQEQHPLNSFASPTPAIEKQRVYAHFGAYGTACVDTESGEILWRRSDLQCEHEVGPGSSPLLYEDLLILTYDGTDVRFLAALNKFNGETVWIKHREVDLTDEKPTTSKAFTTPIVTEIDGINQLISVGPHAAMGYHPATGERIWHARFKGFSASARPIVEDNWLYFNSGFGPSSVVAMRLGGIGDLTDSIQWINKKSTQARSSALLINGLLYMVNTGGQAKCLVAETGEELWTARVGKHTSASPVYVEGNIHTTDEEGLTTIFKPGKMFVRVSENQLPDGMMASPAVVDNALFMRTKTHLYKIQHQ
jgi:outer membrane protein assembly factor BamB